MSTQINLTRRTQKKWDTRIPGAFQSENKAKRKTKKDRTVKIATEKERKKDRPEDKQMCQQNKDKP